jgi:hypothetical protein
VGGNDMTEKLYWKKVNEDEYILVKGIYSEENATYYESEITDEFGSRIIFKRREKNNV